MSYTSITQINLYVTGTFHGGISNAHRIYDLGSNTDGHNPYINYTLDEIHQLDVVQNDFLTVTSATLEVSTTTTFAIPQAATV